MSDQTSHGDDYEVNATFPHDLEADGADDVEDDSSDPEDVIMDDTEMV